VNLDSFNIRYEYKYDAKSRDRWRVLKPDADGMFRGDCEDYSLSVLYYVVSRESWLKFWFYLITFQAHLCGCYTKNGGGHAVLRFHNDYIDNWTKQWVDRDHMKGLGHNFWPLYKTTIATTVAFKMLWAKIDP
jgi:hypothetical protein